MKQKILHVFTNNYPYKGNDYIFFKDEIEFLSKKFKKIKLYPTQKGGIKVNNLKKNIFIDNKINEEIYNPFNIIKIFIRICFYKDLWSEISKLSKKKFLKNIKSIFISRYKAEIVFNFFKKKKISNDIFYSFWSNYILIAFYFLKKKKIINKCFARVLGSDLKGYIKNDSFIEYKELKFSKLDLILTLNNEQRKILILQKLIDKKKIYKNYLGIHHKKLILNYNKKIINFASCGRLIDLKNNHKIFEFIKNFSLKNPSLKVKFYCIGSGPKRKSLINYAKNNFSKNVKFLLINKVSHLVNFLERNKINFFLNFSSSEGMSFAVMEALSCSIPVICSNIPGNTEIINNENGYVLNNLNLNNYNSIADRIIIDYSNKKKYFKKRKKSFETATRKISRKKNQVALSLILDKFVEK